MFTGFWYWDLMEPGTGAIKMVMSKPTYKFKDENGFEYIVGDRPVGWEADIYKKPNFNFAQAAYNNFMNSKCECSVEMTVEERDWFYLNLKGKGKMTRQHAHELVFSKCKTMEGKEVEVLLDAIEALGLIKFEEENKNGTEVSPQKPSKISEVIKLCSAVKQGEFNFRVEQWYETHTAEARYVLWYNGEIVWRSWKPVIDSSL